MKVRYSSAAANDLIEILAYLTDINPAAARKQLARFEATVDQISDFPGIGMKTARPNIHRAVIGNYLLVYEITSDEIIIQFIRHGSRKRPWESN